MDIFILHKIVGCAVQRRNLTWFNLNLPLRKLLIERLWLLKIYPILLKVNFPLHTLLRHHHPLRFIKYVLVLLEIAQSAMTSKLKEPLLFWI
jgi:hypothetical protein